MQFSISRLLFVLTAVVVLLAPTPALAQITGTFGGYRTGQYGWPDSRGRCDNDQ